MSLLIRYDPVEKVLRSVGSPPNGIVCFGAPDDVACWTIDSSWQPPAGPAATPAAPLGIVTDSRPGGIADTAVAITATELADAVESPLEVQALVQAVIAGVHYAWQEFLAALRLDLIRSHIDLADDTLDALEARGYLRRVRVEPDEREDRGHA